MFKLNELLIIKSSLMVNINLVAKEVERTTYPTLKNLRADNLERLTTLYKKVSKQVDISAQFLDDDGKGN